LSPAAPTTAASSRAKHPHTERLGLDEARRPVRAPSFADWFDQLVITMEEGRLEVV